MNILSAKQIHQVDKYTIENEPISSIELMERASLVFVDQFFEYYPNTQSVYILCGKGNNGGDGLAAARLMKYRAINVHVCILDIASESSEDFQINLKRLPAEIQVSYCSRAIEIIPPNPDFLVIDAIFGIGLNRPLEGEFAKIVELINSWPNKKVAIDIPSGLLADASSKGFSRLQVDRTISFQIPKLAFFMPENAEALGEWELVDIGLDNKFIQSFPSTYKFLKREVMINKLPRRDKFSHKGNFGHALIIAGSYGKIGAAILAGKACLRSGVGLLTMHVPRCGYDIIQGSLPEAMAIADSAHEWLSSLGQLSSFSAIGIGPGIGQHLETASLLSDLLNKFQGKLVFDADAINIFSTNRHLLELLPEKSILTPHPGEFKRLVGDWKNDFEKIEMQRAFSEHNKVIIILKGAHTTISDVDGQIYFNSTGNPGMAKGGSGDVLTGIITSFLAQGISEIDSAVLGVYIHGLAGDLANEEFGEKSMLPSDLITKIPFAFQQL